MAQGFLVKGASVFDGEKNIGTRDVRVDGGKISAMAPSIMATRSMEVIDGRGKTLLPGLIDSHSHLTSDVEDELISLRKTALFGVTTAIDPSAPLQPPNSISKPFKSFQNANGSILSGWRSGQAGFPMTISTNCVLRASLPGELSKSTK